jgi:hypothetical protein
MCGLGQRLSNLLQREIGSIADDVEWEGKAVHIHLAPWSTVQRWPEGHTMVRALQMLMQRQHIGASREQDSGELAYQPATTQR